MSYAGMNPLFKLSAIATLTLACMQPNSSHLTVSKNSFGKTPDGRLAELYTLKAGKTVAKITNYGGILVSLYTPDNKGEMGNVVLGYDELTSYFGHPRFPYFGAIIGRFANRIGGASFSLDGRAYHLDANDHGNTLHGGTKGYDKVLWTAKAGEAHDRVFLELTYLSPDGEGGFPGNLTATVTYTLKPGELSIDYKATCDKTTPINLTNHTYFNLSAGKEPTILQHKLHLFASQYTPVDSQLIPTGAVEPVKNSAMDFTYLHSVGEHIAEVPGGYDHNYVVDKSKDNMSRAALLEDDLSGRRLEIWTTQPGLQFYSSNFLDGSLKGAGNVPFVKYAGVALEMQHFPDSPNKPDFPSAILKPGEHYHETTVFRFSTYTL